MKRFLLVFFDWTIAILLISAFTRVAGLEHFSELGFWRFVLMVSAVYLIIQFIRYKITGRVPW